MNQLFYAPLILIFAVALVGCRDRVDVSESNDSSSSETAASPADSFEIVGTVRYKNMEGGFYAIDGDDGKKYDPINLPESFRKDGLKVKVRARMKKDAVSVHMYGEIIEVIEIVAQ